MDRSHAARRQKSLRQIGLINPRYEGGMLLDALEKIAAFSEKSTLIRSLHQNAQLRMDLLDDTLAPEQAYPEKTYPEKSYHVVKLQPRSAQTPNASISLGIQVKNSGAKAVALKQRLMHVIVLGPLEVSIGLVGIVTTVLGILTAIGMGNLRLKSKSAEVLSESGRSLLTGFWHCLNLPWRLVALAWKH